jgi:hypothetical protein
LLRSLKTLLQEDGVNTDVPIREIINSYYTYTRPPPPLPGSNSTFNYYSGTQSILELIARREIQMKHREVDATQSRLGTFSLDRPDLIRSGNTFTQDFAGGRIVFQGNPPEAFVTKESVIQIIGLKCFGTTDGPGSDEPYVITSVYSPDNKFPLQTTRSNIQEDVDDGTVKIFTSKVWSGPPARVQIFTILMEHDNGDPDEVKKAVQDKLNEYVGPDETAAAGAALSAGFGIPIPEGLVRDVAAVLTGGISSLAGYLFGDSRIGTDSFPVLGRDLQNMAETPIPPNNSLDGRNAYTHETLLISGSGASYKVYYNIRTDTISSPNQ